MQQDQDKIVEEKKEKKKIQHSEPPFTLPEIKSDKPFNILRIFENDGPVQQNEGSWKVECPSCGLQGSRTQGLILFPDGDRAYCHSTGKNFNILEAYAMKHKIIKCDDGRGTGEKGTPLMGDIFVQACDHFKNKYTDDDFSRVAELLHLREDIELPGIISKFAVILAKKLKDKNVLYYRPELGGIFEIKKIRHIDGEVEYNGFVDESPSRFVTLTENYFNPWKKIFTKSGELIKYESMNQTVAKVVLDSDQFRNLMPIINRIFNVPIPIIHKGTLTFPQIGYDPRFGSWLPSNAPTIEDPEMSLKDAVELIRWIYSEFCFTDREENDENLSRAVAGLLTPFCKGMFPKFCTRTPIFVFTANRERSGKDYCAGVTGQTFDGNAMEYTPISDGERNTSGKNDELKKLILSVAIKGQTRFHSSNNKGVVDSAVIESMATAERFSIRLLGKNEAPSLDNELLISISGNAGMTFTADLMNRSIFVDLFLDIEDANKRKFDTPELHEWVLANRGKVLSALYSMVRNWIEKGQPDGSIPFASFPVWAKICGGILESAGFINPCITNKKTVIVDRPTDDMKSLFELCYEKYSNEDITKKDIRKILTDFMADGGDLYGYVDWGDSSSRTKFWYNFKKYIGRVFSGITLNLVEENKNSSRNIYQFNSKKDPSNEKEKNKKTPEKTKTETDLKKEMEEIFSAKPENFIHKDFKNHKIWPKNYNFEDLEKDIFLDSCNPCNPCSPLEIEKYSIRELEQHPAGYKGLQGLQSPCKIPKIVQESLVPSELKGLKIEKSYIKIEKPSKNIIKKQAKSEMVEQIPFSLLIGDEKPKEKSSKNIGWDRETQFWDPDCWDTKDMGMKCTKEQTEKWIKDNPGKSYGEMFDALGDGSGKHLVELENEKIVETRDGKLYGN